MKLTSLRKFILFLPGVAALALSPVQAGEGGAVKWHKPVWKQKTGKGYQMCDALLREIKSYEKQLRVPLKFAGGESLCVEKFIIPHSRLFKEPSWEKLDLQQYRPLLRKLFSGEFYIPEESKKKLTPEQIAKTEQEIDKFIADGGYLRTWTMPFPEWMESEARGVQMPLIYVQTVRPIVEKEIQFITNICQGLSLPLSKTITSGVRLVNAKLDGPDRRVMRYPLSSPEYGSTLFFSGILRPTLGTRIYMYKNIPYFFDSTSVYAFSIQKKEWRSRNAACDIYSTEKLK